MEKGKKLDLLALASIPLVMTLGNSMLIPVLPTIENELDITSLQASMIITIYSIVSIMLIPVAGFLSDKYGRKKIIIPSMVIAGIGGIISGFAAWQIENPYILILTGRFIQGVGASGAFPVVIPAVGDMFEKESSVSQGLAIIETSNTSGKVLSPITGAFLATWVWFVPFLSIPVFSAISIALVSFMVKVPKNKDNIKENLKQFTEKVSYILKEKGKWLYSIFVSGMICLFIYYSFLFYFSNILESNFNIQGIKRGLIIALPLLALCMTSYITGKVIGRNKILMKRIISSGHILAFITLLLLAFVQNLTFIIVLLSISGIGIGSALPCLDSLITEGIEKDYRGIITSIYSSTRLLGVALGPPVTAMLMRVGSMAVFFALAAVSLTGAVIICLFVRPDKINTEYAKP